MVSFGTYINTFKMTCCSYPGPSSIGADLCLHGFSHVYGLPEHADSLQLKDTRCVYIKYTGVISVCTSLDLFSFHFTEMVNLIGCITWMSLPMTCTVDWACMGQCHCCWPTNPTGLWVCFG